MMQKLTICIIPLIFFAVRATAQPLTYYVQGAFADGGTFSGSFTYDAGSNRYSNVNITTTAGTVRTAGASYAFVCGQDVPTCTGVTPDATGYLNLTSTAADQTGLPAMSLVFPTPLSTPALFADTEGSLFALEANCSNAACTAPAGPSRSTTAGSIAGSETLFEYLYFGS